LITLGFDQQVLTDYGDESSYALPWDIFDKESADMALRTANQASRLAQQLVSDVSKWREEQ
jgi:hypothetical protein